MKNLVFNNQYVIILNYYISETRKAISILFCIINELKIGESYNLLIISEALYYPVPLHASNDTFCNHKLT